PIPTNGPPMALSPDGTRLVSGGSVLDAETFEVLAPIQTEGFQVAWTSFGLFEISNLFPFEHLNLDRFDDDFVLQLRAPLQDPSLVLAAEPDRMVLIQSGGSEFTYIVYPDDDRDGDGLFDAADLFPDDPSDWADRDGDGVGDHADVFPDDPLDW